MALQQYTGKVVLVERADPGGECSDYDGQYLVYDETSHQLFGQPLDGRNDGLTTYGLGGGWRPHNLPLVGKGAFRVVAVDDVEPWMLEAIDRVEEEIRQVRSGTRKASWIPGVYDKAEGACARLRKVVTAALADRAAAAGPAVDQTDGFELVADDPDREGAEPPTIRITVPRGTRLVVTYDR